MNTASLVAALQIGAFLVRLAEDVRAANGVDGPLSEEELAAIIAETVRQSRRLSAQRADSMDSAIDTRPTT